MRSRRSASRSTNAAFWNADEQVGDVEERLAG
jgi:hypothetical protein